MNNGSVTNGLNGYWGYYIVLAGGKIGQRVLMALRRII
jgi:hypothetical protein